MSKKITAQQFRALKELCGVKGVLFTTIKEEELKNGYYISKYNLTDKNYPTLFLTQTEEHKISFDEVVKILAYRKSRRVVKLNYEHDAYITENEVIIAGEIFKFEAIERLYNAIKE